MKINQEMSFRQMKFTGVISEKWYRCYFRRNKIYMTVIFGQMKFIVFGGGGGNDWRRPFVVSKYNISSCLHIFLFYQVCSKNLLWYFPIVQYRQLGRDDQDLLSMLIGNFLSTLISITYINLSNKNV